MIIISFYNYFPSKSSHIWEESLGEKIRNTIFFLIYHPLLFFSFENKTREQSVILYLLHKYALCFFLFHTYLPWLPSYKLRPLSPTDFLHVDFIMVWMDLSPYKLHLPLKWAFSSPLNFFSQKHIGWYEWMSFVSKLLYKLVY